MVDLAEQRLASITISSMIHASIVTSINPNHHDVCWIATVILRTH